MTNKAGLTDCNGGGQKMGFHFLSLVGRVMGVREDGLLMAGEWRQGNLGVLLLLFCCRFSGVC